MMSSLDGRTILKRWGKTLNTQALAATAATFAAEAWMRARVTVENDFTKSLPPTCSR